MLKELKKPKAYLAAKRVFVGLSGGVDSSVSAYLLKQEGFEVFGVHLRCWNQDGCNIEDSEDARRVAKQLNIPFYVFDLEKEYKEKVVDYMVEGYKMGITPNPDVMCNREIKFGLFLKKALEMKADFVATGHYVKLSENGSVLELHQAKDKSKDQSYFLWTLTQKQLKSCLFPIGDYLKSEVREIAKKAGLPNAEKKDSQGLCFVGKVTLKDFLGEYLPEKIGPVLSAEGEILGEHKGTHLYTIGQRHGLGVALNKPFYISHKDALTNTVVLVEGGENKTLFKKEINLTQVNWISGKELNLPVEVSVRVRYRQPVSKAILSEFQGIYNLKFDKPQKFVAPGQSAVFYSQNDCMLGGAVIQ